MSSQVTKQASSYRDPSGFVFEKDGVVYRQVNHSFKGDFDFFIASGCYKKLVEKKLLIGHEVVPENLTGTPDYYCTLKPEKIDFISYAYEWSFDMLKDAALLTLQLVKESIAYGLMVKDATPFNIQWKNGALIFIDTLSFEKYDATKPWIAYRQFCECFLAPLLLMHYSQQSLQQLLLAYPEGVPLNIASALLPRKSRFSLYTYLHIHLHAKIGAKKKDNQTANVSFSKQKLLNLVSSLESLIRKTKLSQQQTAWSEYYDEAAKRAGYLDQKKKIIQEWITKLPGIKTAADLGANDGVFSKLLAEKNIQTIAADADALCINNLYLDIQSKGLENIQPLIMDLSNPSPAIGLNNKERDSFLQRANVHLVLALAVIHHLAIGKNIPFDRTAELFSYVGDYLFIEFVPKDDEKVATILTGKQDIYPAYREELFVKAFEKFFTVLDRQTIDGTGRILFSMKKREN